MKTGKHEHAHDDTFYTKTTHTQPIGVINAVDNKDITVVFPHTL